LTPTYPGPGCYDTRTGLPQAANGAANGTTSPAATRSKKPKTGAPKAATAIPSSGLGAGANHAAGTAAEAKPKAARDTVGVTRGAVREVVKDVVKQVPNTSQNGLWLRRRRSD